MFFYIYPLIPAFVTQKMYYGPIPQSQIWDLI